MRPGSGLLFGAVLVALAARAQAQVVPCVAGMAGPYPCDKVDMLYHVALSAIGADATGTGNDVWGWTDSTTGKEYALLGLSNATAFVDITDPVNPVYLGRLLAPPAGACVPTVGPAPIAPDHDECEPSPLPIPHLGGFTPAPCNVNSLWRDLEVYNDHVFIGSEQGGHGLVVFDLRQLRGLSGPPVNSTQTARYCGYGASHTTSINTETGFLYANGSRSGNAACGNTGGPHIVDIRTPAAPQFAGCDNTDGYTHDSQCVVYHGPDTAHAGKSICLNSNEDTLTIDDVTTPAAVTRISRTGYLGRGYTHQGWLTADHRYFLLDDELDEGNFGHNTKTYIWDLLDLDKPVVIGTHFGATPAIDHQQFVHGNFVYQSNYSAGLRIAETINVPTGQLSPVGFFDVFPSDDRVDFVGTWSHYPFFRSGVVPITTIENGGTGGFFLLRPRFADLAVTVTDAPDPVGVGQDVTYTFTVRNQGPTRAANARLTDTLPASMTLVSTAPPGACSGTTTVACNLGTIPNGGIATATIVARANALGTVTNTGVASSDENDTRLGDNSATAQTLVAAAAPAGLTVDAGGNGVFQANEGAVTVAPSCRNIGATAVTLTGGASGFTGPAVPTYPTRDASGASPSLAPGASAACADCYSFSIAAATRPAVHWDSSFLETVNPGAVPKTWVLHVGDSFADVPPTNGFHRFIETILHKNVTGGCTATAYCPSASTTRDAMAVFVLVSREPAGYLPPACGAVPMFTDVPASSGFCRWVEELARRGVVAGCAPGLYCPTAAATREQMAVFVLRTLDPALNPPPCTTPVFADVPASSGFCRWIEELFRRGVVTGCGGGNYCPTAPVTREQMSVFLAVTFGLALYGV